MAQILKKLARKTGVVLRGGWRPVMDRRSLLKSSHGGFDPNTVGKGGYHGQWGQDKWVVENIFKHRRGGIFVDIGAYNGLDISNTYYLEEQLGWSGICIEPSPKLFAELTQNRKCTCVQACIAASDGEVEFLQVEDAETLNSLATTLDQTRDVRVVGRPIKRLKLPGFRLDTLLRKHNIQKVDFISIDTEGSEMEILRNFQWETFEINVLCVENTYYGDLLAEFLYGRGYRLNAILGGDEIYTRA